MRHKTRSITTHRTGKGKSGPRKVPNVTMRTDGLGRLSVRAKVDVKGANGFWYRATVTDVKTRGRAPCVHVEYPQYPVSHSEWVSEAARVRPQRPAGETKAENARIGCGGAAGFRSVGGRAAYYVDNIIGKRQRLGGTKYLVLWAGKYKPSVQQTWEPRANILDTGLIDCYEAAQRPAKPAVPKPTPFILDTAAAGAGADVQKQRADDAFWLESNVSSSAVRALERQTRASTTPVLLFTAALPDFLALALHARLRSAAKARYPAGGPAPLVFAYVYRTRVSAARTLCSPRVACASCR